MKYQGIKKFDHDTFWDWAAEQAQKHRVFVSEETAPDEWEAVWERPVTRRISQKQGKKSFEKLFVYSASNSVGSTGIA